MRRLSDELPLRFNLWAPPRGYAVACQHEEEIALRLAANTAATAV